MMADIWTLIDQHSNSPSHHTEPIILGYIRHPVALALQALSPPLLEHVVINSLDRTISLSGRTLEARSLALAEILSHWRASKAFPILQRWRDEQIGIHIAPSELFATVERAAAPLFGLVGYYVFLIAFSTSNNTFKIWIQKRAKGKNHGGMLDCTVAGAIGARETPFQSLAREASEEAGFSDEIARRAVPVKRGEKVLSIWQIREEAGGYLRPGCGWGFEVELKEGEAPAVVDGEVEEFNLMDLDELKADLLNGEFMPNAGKVLVEWFGEKGKIGIEEVNLKERDYPFPLMM
jgi:8-oxo-dGTP pyrophosphatase MutT (NUDIX family)